MPVPALVRELVPERGQVPGPGRALVLVRGQEQARALHLVPEQVPAWPWCPRPVPVPVPEPEQRAELGLRPGPRAERPWRQWWLLQSDRRLSSGQQ